MRRGGSEVLNYRKWHTGYAIAAEQAQRDNPLKHVKDTIEQNDNNFDGLINEHAANAHRRRF